MSLKSLIPFVTGLFLCFASLAQTGIINSNFNNEMLSTFGDGTGANNTVSACAEQADGKILIGGMFTSINGVPKAYMARLNPNGGLDETFTLDPNVANSSVSTIVVKPDGKILIGGYFNNLGNSSCMAQLNPDGTLDPNFNTPPTGSYVHEIIQLSSGDYLIAAESSPIIKMSSTGIIDASFFSGTGSNGRIQKILEQPDGKLLIGGEFTTYNGQTHNKLLRINADGTADGTFSIGSGFDNQVRGLALQNDGKIIAVGSFSTFNGQSRIGLIRLTASGSEDPTFNITASGYTCSGFDVIKDSNDDFVVVGTPSSYYGDLLPGIFRFDANGTFDTQFLNIPNALSVLTVLERSSGGYFFGGDFTEISQKIRKNIAAINSDFTLDNDFALFPGFNSTVWDVMNLPNGNILVGGDFTIYNDTIVKGLVELKVDGSIDTDFEYVNSSHYLDVRSIAKLPNGEFIAGGVFQNYSLGNSRSVVRINSDGTVDETFSIVNITDGNLNKVLVQPDGKIIVAGVFSSVNGQTLNGIFRLLSDGTIDASFNTGGSGTLGEIIDLKLASDGGVYACGNFTNYNGVSTPRIVKLTPNGAIDPSFVNSQTLSGTAYSIDMINEDTLLIGGALMINFQEKNVVRILSNGTIDNSFTPMISNTSGGLKDLLVQPDGKIVVCGDLIGLTSGVKLARLNADGTIDTDFINSVGSTMGRVVTLRSDGKIVLGGMFKNIQGQAANRIMLFDNDVLGFSDLDLSFSNIQDISCATSGTITAAGMNGTPPYTFSWPGFSNSALQTQTITTPGVYTCILTDNSGHSITKSQYIDGYTSNAQSEIEANLISSSFRPGFTTEVLLDMANYGCVDANGQLELTLSPLTSFISSVPAPNSINGNVLNWSYPSLTFGGSHFTIAMLVETNTSAVIGDTVEFELDLTTSTTDFNETNNHKTYDFAVINGYDPNIKAVYPIGKCEEHYVDSNQVLTYTVKFQNTGNSEAINIYVLDSINENLDVSSLRVLASSHEMNIEVLTNNILKFNFDSIMLPDSTSNEMESHGYVIFDIRPEMGLFNGSVLPNKAEIYFDFNDPVVTNTVFNTLSTTSVADIECNLTVGEEESDKLIIYPNPVSEVLTLNSGSEKEGIQLDIFNSLGCIVHSQTVSNNSVDVNVSNYTAGVYIVCVNGIRKMIIVE